MINKLKLKLDNKMSHLIEIKAI